MRPRSSNVMVTGWRIIGSEATRRTSRSSGAFMRRTASSGEKPWAAATVQLRRKTPRLSKDRTMGAIFSVEQGVARELARHPLHLLAKQGAQELINSQAVLH